MRQYNLIIYGASGFTGKLICEYIYNQSKNNDIIWAIAGRNKNKLIPLSKKFAVDYIVADSFNKDQLDYMCQSTDVIISTVGPYDIYGEVLVLSCIDNKTHYLDLTGEFSFVKRIDRLYSQKAIDKNVILIHCCGLDSLPPDLCTYLALKNIHSDSVDIEYNLQSKGKISGGTWASVINISSKSFKKLNNVIEPNNGKGKNKLLSFNDNLNKWKLLYPAIDRYIVLKTIKSQFPSINVKSFKLYLVLPSYLSGLMLISGFSIISLLSRINIIKNLLLKIVPSGRGPNEEERNSHWFKSQIVIKTNNKKVISEMKGGDPGYTETSKFISELALCIVTQYKQLNQKKGILTPMECAGELIIDRLKKRDIAITVNEES